MNLCKLIFNYNLKYVYKKILMFVLPTIVLAIFNILNSRYFQNISFLDIVILNFGGYELENIGLIQEMICIFPYILIGYAIELYIEDIVNNNMKYTLIRIQSNKVFYLSHMITILIMNIIFFLLYDSISIGIYSLFFKGSFISKTFSNYIIFNSKLLPFSNIMLNIISVQIIGTMFMACFQLFMTKFSKKKFTGFLGALLIYIVHIAFPKENFIIGQHVLITSINVLSKYYNKTSIGIFLIVNIIGIVVLSQMILMNKSSLLNIE